MLPPGQARSGEPNQWQFEVAASRAPDRHKADGELNSTPSTRRARVRLLTERHEFGFGDDAIVVAIHLFEPFCGYVFVTALLG